MLAALQGTWKLAIREEVGKEGTDIGDPCTIKNDRLALQFPHRSLLIWSLFVRVGPTTPTRATARARKQPTRSTPKLARVRQPRTTVVNPA